MKGVTAILPCQGQSSFELSLQAILSSRLVRKVFVVHAGGFKEGKTPCISFEAPSIGNGRLWNRLLSQARTQYLLLVDDYAEIRWGPQAIARLIEAAETTKAGIVYADYGVIKDGRHIEHPVNDYQPGSIRDDFHFGPVMLISVAAARFALKKHGSIPDFHHAGLYDLRLKISSDFGLFHLQEFLYMKIDDQSSPAFFGKTQIDGRPSPEKHFDYVDPRNEKRQREMEAAATEHLKRIGAFLKPIFREPPPSRLRSDVEASVIIPVRNRKGTVAAAIKSAMTQKTDFPYNIICIDNHSTDGTTQLLSGLAKRHPALHHVVPQRTDLGIGGCWNEAIFSAFCGRYAVQLDSDDIYSGFDTLQKIVDLLRRGNYAIVIGSYMLVDEKLKEIPPGLIDHREWTDDNGRNNALRINGLGAPRAFRTEIARRFGFLNVSYGEDYAMALRFLREYRLGRIYENLYFCRRWKDNTDAGLTVEKVNRHDAFKDKIRTLEIMARQAQNRA